MTTTYTLQVGQHNMSPPGWEDVITGTEKEVLDRYYQYSHMFRCSHPFRVVKVDGEVWEMDKFQWLNL